MEIKPLPQVSVSMDEVIDVIKQGGIMNLGDGLFSFVWLLRKQLRQRKPKRIIEWGSGLSTLLMATELPDAEIVTIENDLKWFMYWSQHFAGYRNIKMYPLSLERNYVDAPYAMGKFDMAFVDGVDATRAACLEVAAQVLNPDGCALVHDSEREYYWPPINKYFCVVDESERKWNSHTVCLELKKNE